MCRDCSNARADSGRLHNCADVARLVGIAFDLSFAVRRFIAACAGVGGYGIKIHGVAVGKDHRVEAHADFALPFDFAGTLGFLDFPLHVCAGRDEYAVLDDNREKSFEIYRIAGMGVSRGHGIVQHQWHACTGRHQ